MPQGYPHSWAESEPDYGTHLQTVLANATYCDETENDLYDYTYSASWIYGGFRCTKQRQHHESHFLIGKNVIYFPTYYQETWTEVADGSANCAALNSTCNHDPTCDGAATPFGVSCFNGDPALSDDTCSCKTDSHYFVSGVEKQSMHFLHFFGIDKDDGTRLEGFSSNTEQEALSRENRVPVLTRIQTYDPEQDQWVEFDCYDKMVQNAASASVEPPSAATPLPGRCRFAPGTSIGMSIENWLEAAGVLKADGGLDAQNINGGANKATLVDGQNLPFPIPELHRMQADFFIFSTWTKIAAVVVVVRRKIIDDPYTVLLFISQKILFMILISIFCRTK